MNKHNLRQRLLPTLHLLIIVAAYTSFLWLDWRLIIVAVLIYWAQIFTFDACVISICQYGNTDTSFSAKLIGSAFETMGLRIPHKDIRTFLDWVWPEIVIIAALYIQVVLSIDVAFKL